MPPLNPAQHEAVHTLSGPMLVLAGAGTGKTRVVTFRIANLIKHKIRPERILAVTFTNKAAAEMLERARALLGKKRPTRAEPEISTFHSLCVRVLRRHIAQLGYPEQFAIYDRGDQEGAARDALRQIRVPGETLRPGDLLSMISRWKSSCLRPADALSQAESDKQHLAAVAYRRYQENLKSAGAVDFDDLLLLVEDLFARFPKVRRAEAERFDHLLVDEYQDTNGSQYRIVKALAAGHRNLCVVGDDDQSIYGWRGAEVAHILRFQRDWPEAKVVRLVDNYRSTEAILAFANRLIAFNSERHPKQLIAARPGGDRPRIWQAKDEEHEAEEVVADIQQKLTEPGVEPRDFAILFRTNEQPRPYEMALRKAGLPYVLIGGMSFYDRKEVRDVLAYLKLVANPRDEVSLLRVINTPARGIGQASVKLLTDAAVERGVPLWEALPTAAANGEVPYAAAQAIDGLRKLIEEFAARESAKGGNKSLVSIVTDLIEAVGYRAHLERTYPEELDRQARWATIEEVVNALGRYEAKAKRKRSLAGFLEEVALAERDEADDKESNLARNAIVLMTLHSAKGLEFPQVYMVGLEESILPHHRAIADGDAAIEEERRLCYVGVTRAQERLTLTLSLTRMKWGKVRETLPSRYLYELTGQAENASDSARAATQKRHKTKPRGPAGKKKRAAKKKPAGAKGRAPRRK
jgi:DNA helicase-2/ATP-dependent DNA helicase PcrA